MVTMPVWLLALIFVCGLGTVVCSEITRAHSRRVARLNAESARIRTIYYRALRRYAKYGLSGDDARQALAEGAAVECDSGAQEAAGDAEGAAAGGSGAGGRA